MKILSTEWGKNNNPKRNKSSSDRLKYGNTKRKEIPGKRNKEELKWCEVQLKQYASRSKIPGALSQ